MRSFLIDPPAGPTMRPRPVVRRRRRPAIGCEGLETRQLLTAGAAATAAAQDFLQVVPMAGGGTAAYTPQQIRTA